jgi:hypothetical protein
MITDRPIGLPAAEVAGIAHRHRSSVRRVVESQLGKVRVGDRLWVREPFHLEERFDRVAPLLALECGATRFWYAADGDVMPGFGPARYARTMPRACSRLWLRVDAVDTGPLQSITPEQAEAEGAYHRSWPVGGFDVEGWAIGFEAARKVGVADDPITAFRRYWDMENPVDQGLGGSRVPIVKSWAANPTVIAIRFTPAWANIDAPAKVFAA